MLNVLGPNISSKSSSNLTALNSSPFHLQFAGLANAVIKTLSLLSFFPFLRADPERFSLILKGMATLEMAAAQVIGARGQIENWADSGMAVSSPITDTSTDLDTDERIKNLVSAINNNFLVCSVLTR